MNWTAEEMQMLGEQLIVGLPVPDGMELSVIASENPARLLFIARHAYSGRAGAAGVSRSALEDRGRTAATFALTELWNIINMGQLPLCDEGQPARLLGTQTSEGWRAS